MTPVSAARHRLTLNNSNHKALENAAAVESLIDVAAQGPKALADYLAQGNDLHVGAGKKRDINALHALARKHSGANGGRGVQDRQALAVLLDAGFDVSRTNKRGETAFFRALVVGLEWYVEEFCRRNLDDWSARNAQGKDFRQARDPSTQLPEFDAAVAVLEERCRARDQAQTLDAVLPAASPLLKPRL